MWKLLDVWLVFRRQLAMSLRNPAWIAIGVLQPVLYLGLFGPLLEPIVRNTPGFPPGDAWQILTPALLIQLGLFNGLFVGFALLGDLRTGVLERLRVTPVSRVALLLGRVLHDGLQLVVQALLLLTLSFAVFGLRAPIGGVAFGLLVVLLTGMALSSCSYALALLVRSEEAFPALLTSVSLPLLLLSGILLPIEPGLAPDWLYHLAQLNPFTHIVAAERDAFRGDFGSDSVLLGGVLLVALTTLAVAWGARTFRRENA